MDYAALNGDLVASRTQGPEAPRRLAQVIEEANQRYAKILTAPFAQSKGDAFQALLRNPGHFPRVLLWMEARLREKGLAARYGVGLGEVEGLQGAFAPSPALLTGPAFLRAEAALAEAREKRILAAIQSGEARWDGAANAALLLLGYLANRWPQGAWRRLRIYLETGQFKAVAAAEGVSYQAVYKQFADRGVRTALLALERLAKGLEDDQ